MKYLGPSLIISAEIKSSKTPNGKNNQLKTLDLLLQIKPDRNNENYTIRKSGSYPCDLT